MDENVPPNQTVNQQFYVQAATKLQEPFRKKKRTYLWSCGWFLHQDNASVHRAILVRQFLAERRTPALEHAPYLSGPAMYDLFIFLKLKYLLKGT